MHTCGATGEVCHAHPSDGSLHMTLHPADAAIVIENGWGERHPLARGGWCRRFVPREFVLVYAPRDERDVEVIMRIVRAAVWWVAGIDVQDEDEWREVGAETGAEDGFVGKQQAAARCRVCGMRTCGATGSENVERMAEKSIHG